MNRSTIDRTKDQEFANDLDCELYRLIVRAERQTDKRWRRVVEALRDARPAIRVLMHAKDRDDTI